MWDLQCLTTLWAFTACYRDSFLAYWNNKIAYLHIKARLFFQFFLICVIYRGFQCRERTGSVCRKIGDDDLGRIWKKAVVAWSKYFPSIYLEGLRKSRKPKSKWRVSPTRFAPSASRTASRPFCSLWLCTHLLSPFINQCLFQTKTVFMSYIFHALQKSRLTYPHRRNCHKMLGFRMQMRVSFNTGNTKITEMSTRGDSITSLTSQLASSWQTRVFCSTYIHFLLLMSVPVTVINFWLKHSCLDI
jgi:hypothetical protein